MKTLAKMILMVAIISPSFFSQSQTVRELIKQRKEQLTGGSNSTAEMPSEGQRALAKNWDSGEYTYFDQEGPRMMREGTRYIRIIKDENGEVITVRLGEGSAYDMESEKYNPYSFGGSEFVCAFVQNNNNCLYFTEEMIVHYSCNSKYEVDVINWSLNSKKKVSELKAEIQAYRDYGKGQIEEDRDRVKEEEIAHRKQYTLEGKEVTSIRPVFPNGTPSKINFEEKIQVGFEVTLADGSVLKTSNVGGHAYVEDLEVESVNSDLSGVGTNYVPGSYGANPKTSAYLTANGSDANKDFVLVKVRPKYSGSGECTIKLPIEYGMEAHAFYSGSMGSSSSNYSGFGGNGSDGPDIVAKVKAVKHSETGETIYACRVGLEGSSRGKLYKIAKGGTFYISSVGGSGGDGGPGHDRTANDGYVSPEDGGPGGDGGDGGSIKVYVDPSATTVPIQCSVSGGAGGAGGTKGTCFSCSYGSDGNHGSWGNAGNEGTIHQEVKAVTL